MSACVGVRREGLREGKGKIERLSSRHWGEGWERHFRRSDIEKEVFFIHSVSEHVM